MTLVYQKKVFCFNRSVNPYEWSERTFQLAIVGISTMLQYRCLARVF